MKRLISVMTAAVMCAAMTLPVSAAVKSETKTNIDKQITVNDYKNWEGVSNVAQFKGSSGEFCFAYDGDRYVTVVKTDVNGNVLPETILLEKKHSLFGTVVCDGDGNYYLVTGEASTASSYSGAETIFVSKYDRNGSHIADVGDNGSSSLASYYDESYYTKKPFDAGSCDAAINGNLLAVNYAREMYSGHQSNSVLVVNIDTMTKEKASLIYQSHSFGQRAIPYSGGFVFAGEGDCYDRAFTVWNAQKSNTGFNIRSGNVFHFWVRENALKDSNMTDVNNNFAHIGGIVKTGNNIALVGTSAPSLNENAKTEIEQLFIQIFDPSADLGQGSSYITSGTRSGLGGPNGNEQVTDYGVKWLTGITSGTISNPQAVSDEKGNIIVLYESKDGSNNHKGVYYMILDPLGNIVQDAELFSEEAYLDPYRMPVYSGGRVYWTGNHSGSSGLYVNVLDLNGEKGDLDNDGIVSDSDLTILRGAVASDSTEDLSGSADLNNDGKINNKDIILMRDMIAKSK